MRRNWISKWTLIFSDLTFIKTGNARETSHRQSSIASGLFPFINRLLLSGWMMVLIIISSTCSPKDTVAEQYTCPMHPSVVADKQGTCPVCGMELVRKARAGEEIEIKEDLARLLPSTDEVIVSNVSTIKGKYQSLSSAIEVQGLVTYDTRYLYTISSRVGGRLEKVSIKSAFQPVTKGQKIAEIYSPELITAQRELLFLIDHDTHNTTLMEAAKEKLRLLGLTTAQLNTIITKKEITSSFSIHSAYDGYVISENVTTTPTTSSSGSTEEMNAGITNPMTTARSETSLLRTGDYVTAGQTLFKIANTSALRVELSLPATQATMIKVNDELKFNREGAMEKGKVDFIQPYTENGEELVRIRVYLSDAKDLKVGQLVTATIQHPSPEGLWIPNAAVLDLGLKQVVFIRNNGVFKAKEIKTGARSNGWTEVQGIVSADEIASDAHYLVDSEALIKTLN